MSPLLPLLTLVSAMAAPTELTRATFSGGRVVVVLHDPSASFEQVAVVQPLGRADTPVADLPHLYEHLWFRTRDPRGVETWDALRASACVSNAHTYEEATSYESVCPPSAWPRLVDLEVQRIRDPLAGLQTSDVALEQAIVLRERVERAGFEDLVLIPEIVRRLGGSAAAPSLTDVTQVTEADVRAWQQQLGQAGHVVAFAGPVGASDILPRFADALAEQPVVEALGWDGEVVKVLRLPKPPEATPRAAVDLRAPADDPMVVLAWRLPPGLAGSTGEHAMLETALTEHFGAAVGTVEDVLWGDCGMEHEGSVSFVMCAATLKRSAKPALVLEAIRDAWGAQRRKLASSADSLMKVVVQADLLNRMHEIDAEDLAFGQASSGDPWLSARIQRGGSTFRPSTARELAAWLHPDLAVTFRIAPDADVQLTSVQLPQVEATPPVAAADLSELPSPPAVTTAYRRLSNGAQVLVIEDPRQEVATLGLRLRGGLARWPAGLAPMPLSASLDWRPGPHVELSGTDVTGSTWMVVARPDGLDEALGRVLKDMTRWTPLPTEAPDDAVVDWFEDIYDTTRRDALLRRIDQDPTWWADRLTRVRTVPHHPETNWYDRVFVDTSDPDAIRKFFATASAIHHPQSATVVVVSPSPAEEVLAWVDRSLVAWEWDVPRPQAPVPVLPAPTTAASTSRFVIDEPKSAAASITLRCRIITPDPEAAGWVDMLGEQLQTHLFNELRRAHGWAYSPDVDVDLLESGSIVLRVGVVTGPEVAGEVLAAVERAPAVLAGDASGVLSAWRATRVDQVATLQDPFRLVADLLHAGDRKLSPEARLEQLRSAHAAPSADAVRRAWTTCGSRLHSVTTGPASYISDALTEAGLEHEVVSVARLAKRAAERRGGE